MYQKGGKIFGCEITKVTPKCVYIVPTCPTGKARYTLKEIAIYEERKARHQRSK